jgi:hypothetical protein
MDAREGLALRRQVSMLALLAVAGMAVIEDTSVMSEDVRGQVQRRHRLITQEVLCGGDVDVPQAQLPSVSL